MVQQVVRALCDGEWKDMEDCRSFIGFWCAVSESNFAVKSFPLSNALSTA